MFFDELEPTKMIREADFIINVKGIWPSFRVEDEITINPFWGVICVIFVRV